VRGHCDGAAAVLADGGRHGRAMAHVFPLYSYGFLILPISLYLICGTVPPGGRDAAAVGGGHRRCRAVRRDLAGGGRACGGRGRHIAWWACLKAAAGDIGLAIYRILLFRSCTCG